MSVKFSINFARRRNVKRNTSLLNEKPLFLDGTNGCFVMLIHGITGTPYEMWFLARSLNKAGYSVMCPRLANHGENIDILKNTKWQEWYESARKAFLEAESANREKTIFLSGLSAGALMALLIADEFKGRVRGVSCLSPTLFYDGWNMPWSRHLLPLAYATFLRYFFYFKENPPYGIKNEAIRRRVHQYYSNAKPQDSESVMQFGYPYIPVSLICQNRLLVNHLKKRLPYIDVPVQLIQAKDDDMTSVKNSQYIYDRIKSEIKEMILLYNSYHVITADQERDKVALEMEKFFNRLKYNKGTCIT